MPATGSVRSARTRREPVVLPPPSRGGWVDRLFRPGRTPASETATRTFRRASARPNNVPGTEECPPMSKSLAGRPKKELADLARRKGVSRWANLGKEQLGKS